MNADRKFKGRTFFLAVLACFISFNISQTFAQSLSHLDFFYAGEAKTHNMYIVKDGKITWSYNNPASKGEISDAILLPGGDILFAHQFGISILDKGKNITWNYDAPPGCEIHTVVPSGKKHLIFMQNGKKPKVVVMDRGTKRIVKEFPVEVRDTNSVHGQFRHARLTEQGTLLVAHMDWGKVREYDADGNVLLSLDVPRPWSAEPLKNGNILVCSAENVLELDRNGKTVWQADAKILTDNRITSPQIAVRLDNGNTLVNNWFNQWNGPADPATVAPQAIEITPENKLVWVLSSWTEPLNLGPSTTILPLSRVGKAQKLKFGKFD